MSTIQGSGQTPIYRNENVSGSADDGQISVTGDALLKLYELRLAHVQGRIDSLFTTMNISQKQSDALNAVQAKLAQYAGGITTDAQYKELDDTIAAQIASLPANDPVAAQLSQLRASGTMTTNGQGGTDKTISADEMKSLSTTVDGMQKNVDTDNQKVGINLNVFMGQLGELNSLFSNSIESLHQAAMAPINNIKS